MTKDIARHFTVDLTAASGAVRLVLAHVDVDTLTHAELETQIAKAMLAVEEMGDGTVALHRPGEAMPSDEEFEAVEAVSAADAILDIREFANIG